MGAPVFNGNRRVINMLLLGAAVMLSIATIHSLTGGSSPEWVSDHVKSLVGDRGRLSMKEHMRLAEASWAKTVKQRHDLIRQDYGTTDKVELFPAVDVPTYFQHPFTIWDFTPASYGCPHEMERIGRMGDGGKWVCGMSRYEQLTPKQKCVVYSFGVQTESSFENEILSRTNCEVWAYDFSVVDFGVQLEPENRARAHFMQAGIAGKSDETRDPPFYSIADLMKMNGHDYIDILKMDIEFAEFEAMDGLRRDFPVEKGDLPIGQWMVEIHFFNGLDATGYLKWWEALEARGMRPTWTEPNLLAVTLGLGPNHNPTLAEYTFVNVHDRQNKLFGGVSAHA